MWFWNILLYSRYNFLIRSIFYYLSPPINKMHKLPIPMNVFQLNCIIIFDKLLKMISTKKFHSYLKWFCTKKKSFIVFYLNELYNSLNLALNLRNCRKNNPILQMLNQYLFALLWFLNLCFFLGNQIIVAMIFHYQINYHNNFI